MARTHAPCRVCLRFPSSAQFVHARNVSFSVWSHPRVSSKLLDSPNRLLTSDSVITEEAALPKSARRIDSVRSGGLSFALAGCRTITPRAQLARSCRSESLLTVLYAPWRNSNQHKQSRGAPHYTLYTTERPAGRLQVHSSLAASRLVSDLPFRRKLTLLPLDEREMGTLITPLTPRKFRQSACVFELHASCVSIMSIVFIDSSVSGESGTMAFCT